MWRRSAVADKRTAADPRGAEATAGADERSCNAASEALKGAITSRRTAELPATATLTVTGSGLGGGCSSGGAGSGVTGTALATVAMRGRSSSKVVLAATAAGATSTVAASATGGTGDAMTGAAGIAVAFVGRASAASAGDLSGAVVVAREVASRPLLSSDSRLSISSAICKS